MTTPMQLFDDRFPNIKLSYDKINHNIVCGDLYMLIPFGIKVFAWFTYFNKNNVCFIIEKNGNNVNIRIQQVSFCDDLCNGKYGTILYGSFIKNSQTDIRYFYIEDVFYYKGSEISSRDKIRKISCIRDIFNNLNQNIYTQNQVGFCAPTITTSKESAIEYYFKSEFSVYCIVSVHLNSYNTKCCFENLKNLKPSRIETKVFIVKPDIKNDIYKLYTVDPNGIFNFDSYALITSYELSKTMNTIFRRIKENDNLDSLEESDDEDEFENISESKYIQPITDNIFMHCNYSKRFNKWIPDRIMNPRIMNP